MCPLYQKEHRQSRQKRTLLLEVEGELSGLELLDAMRLWQHPTSARSPKVPNWKERSRANEEASHGDVKLGSFTIVCLQPNPGSMRQLDTAGCPQGYMSVIRCEPGQKAP